MWFKNLIFYKLTGPFDYNQEQLQEQLQMHAFSPCKSQELSRYGWSNPCQPLEQELVHPVQGFYMISAFKEEKILPSAVIKQSLNAKVSQTEQEQTRKVYKKEKDQLKDEIILDLLPRAFSKYQKTYALIAPQQGWLAIDSASHKRAEELLSFLRGSLGSLQLALPEVQHSPSAIMSHWLENPEDVPTAFNILDECELRDSLNEGGVIRVKGQQLEDDEFLAHLEAGKRVVKLALEWDEQLKFILQDDLAIKRLKLTEQLQEQLAQDATDDAIAEFDASMVQMALELSKLYPQLIDAFGGEAIRP